MFEHRVTSVNIWRLVAASLALGIAGNQLSYAQAPANEDAPKSVQEQLRLRFLEIDRRREEDLKQKMATDASDREYSSVDLDDPSTTTDATPGSEAEESTQSSDSEPLESSQQKSLDESFAKVDPQRVPRVINGGFQIPVLSAKSTATDMIGSGSTPDEFQRSSIVQSQWLAESARDRLDDGSTSDWDWAIVQWDAANTFSKPRYFEDRMLERHGHQRFGDVLQPVASGVRFFSSVVSLPYKMAVDPPRDDEFTYGYFRPGSAVGRFVQRPPWDRKGVAAQSAAIVGGILIFP